MSSFISPREGYDLWAPSYGCDMNPVQILEGQALDRLLPDLKGRAVLDLGCGRGRVTRLALERGAAGAVGLDFSFEMLKRASADVTAPLRSRLCGRFEWVHGNALTLPFQEQVFDVVISALMMGHIPDLEAALAQVDAVLKPGGVLLISDFHPYAALRGWQRSFVDESSGREYAIEQHPHLLDHYLRCLEKLSYTPDAVEEPLYEGFPLVFSLRASKAGA